MYTMENTLCPSRVYLRDAKKRKKKKPTNTIHLIGRIEEKPETVILVDTEKTFDKIQYPSKIITLN